MVFNKKGFAKEVERYKLTPRGPSVYSKIIVLGDYEVKNAQMFLNF